RSSRVSSASRSSEAAVKPTRSAKRTETRRRSAVGATAAGAAAEASASSAAPHSSQNRALAETGWPFGQSRSSGGPQDEQNLASARFSVPQLGQVMPDPPQAARVGRRTRRRTSGRARSRLSTEGSARPPKRTRLATAFQVPAAKARRA